MAAWAGCGDDPVEPLPDAIERFRHGLGVANGLRRQLGTSTRDHLRHGHRHLGVALFNSVRETLTEIRLGNDLREMLRQRFGQRAHPVVRHNLNPAP